MKRISTIVLASLLCATLIVAPVFAQDKSGKGCTKPCPVTSCPMKMKAEQAKAGEEKEAQQAGHDCANKGNCKSVTLKMDGLKEGKELTDITDALKAEKGVIKVCSIDAISGEAILCFDPDQVKAEDLAKLVTQRGYKTEILAGSETGCASKK